MSSMRRASSAIAKAIEEALARLKILPTQIDGQLAGTQVAPAASGSPGVVDLDGLLTDPTTTPGDLIYRDGAGLQRLPIGTPGQNLGVDVGGLPTWGAGGGGGGGAPTDAAYLTTAANGTLSAEVVIPGLGGSADRAGVGGAGTSREFQSGDTAPAWSPSSPATADVGASIPSQLFARTTDATIRFALYAWSPAGAFEVTSKISFGSRQTTATPFVALVVTASDTGDRVEVQAYRNEGVTPRRMESAAGTVVGGANTQRGVLQIVGGSGVYLRISRDGSNNVSFWWSSDGLTWNLIATQAFTLTVASVGYRFGGAECEFAADFLRTSV